MTKANYNKKKFQDLKETIELRNAEIDELNMQLATKDKEINKFKITSLNKNMNLKHWNLKWIVRLTMKKAKLKSWIIFNRNLKENKI